MAAVLVTMKSVKRMNSSKDFNEMINRETLKLKIIAGVYTVSWALQTAFALLILSNNGGVAVILSFTLVPLLTDGVENTVIYWIHSESFKQTQVVNTRSTTMQLRSNQIPSQSASNLLESFQQTEDNDQRADWS